VCDLVTLEQFRNSLPSRVATYLNERKVTTVTEATGLADEYVLIHKSWPGETVLKDGGGRSPTHFGDFSGKVCNDMYSSAIYHRPVGGAGALRHGVRDPQGK